MAPQQKRRSGRRGRSGSSGKSGWPALQRRRQVAKLARAAARDEEARLYKVDRIHWLVAELVQYGRPVLSFFRSCDSFAFVVLPFVSGRLSTSSGPDSCCVALLKLSARTESARLFACSGRRSCLRLFASHSATTRPIGSQLRGTKQPPLSQSRMSRSRFRESALRGSRLRRSRPRGS